MLGSQAAPTHLSPTPTAQRKKTLKTETLQLPAPRSSPLPPQLRPGRGLRPIPRPSAAASKDPGGPVATALLSASAPRVEESCPRTPVLHHAAPISLPRGHVQARGRPRSRAPASHRHPLLRRRALLCPARGRGRIRASAGRGPPAPAPSAAYDVLKAAKTKKAEEPPRPAAGCCRAGPQAEEALQLRLQEKAPGTGSSGPRGRIPDPSQLLGAPAPRTAAGAAQGPLQLCTRTCHLAPPGSFRLGITRRLEARGATSDVAATLVCGVTRSLDPWVLMESPCSEHVPWTCGSSLVEHPEERDGYKRFQERILNLPPLYIIKGQFFQRNIFCNVY
ncbi:uncharacterized protein [Canis lupus baileyi]|uniref:uncharacterized protein n=1 Tax=Canis lupus baileyi TaxID=143281 RepID=UPI003B9755FC